MTFLNLELIETLLNIVIIFISFPENTLLLLTVMFMGMAYSWLKLKNEVE